MRFIYLLLLSFLGSFHFALAQNQGKVSGQVHSEIKGAAEQVMPTISLIQVKDSTIMKQMVAGKDGAFVFENITYGKYKVAITAIGYQRIHSAFFEITQAAPEMQLPIFRLVPVSKAMAGVTVTAKRPLVEQKVDRTIVNVEAAVTNAGATALEVLEKSPGVLVDKDGNISLKGKEGVLVLIDGRPTQLSGADLANLLRNMNANQMDQVEIMTNPPARYDAAGNAGVINIKTKKSKAVGYNGSATVGYTQGKYPKTNEGFNFNYREGKLNVFTNLSHNYRKGFEKLTIQRNIFNGDNSAVVNHFDLLNYRIMEGNTYNAKLGLDFFASKRTTYGVVFNGFSNSANNINENQTDISTATKELQSITKATGGNKASWKNFSTNLNFRTVLDSAGREFTAEMDYITFGSSNDQTLISAYYNAAGNSIDKGDTILADLPQHINVYSGRMDYLHPLKKGAKFEAGLKTSFARTDNNANYDSILNGSKVHDYNRSNHFLYEENINAAYVNLSSPVTKKINMQLGLRLENTTATGHQLTTGVKFERQYTQLFPTAYFQYTLDKKNNLGLNYGRRIRRPNYESLNPFIKFIDRYTYSQGNPNLKPQLSNNIELTHTYNNILTTTLNYTATNDILQGVIEQKGQEAYSTQANLASLRQYGVAISLNNPVTKWWTNTFYINVFNNSFEGVVNTTPIAFKATRFLLNTSQQFKLSKSLSAEVAGIYRSAGVDGVIMSKPVGGVMAGFSQQVLKNKGTIRLAVRDIFYTQKGRAVTKYGNVDAAFQNVQDSRTVNIGFSYRFSKGKLNTPKKRNIGSANEEQNRMDMQ
jgi:hypothetical protein